MPPRRGQRARRRARPEDGLTAHRSPHPPPNAAFSQTPCTPCPGRGTTTASRRAPPTPRRLCLCGRTCSLRAPTTRRTRRGACARRPRTPASIDRRSRREFALASIFSSRKTKTKRLAPLDPLLPTIIVTTTQDAHARLARARRARLARVPTGDHRRGHRGVTEARRPPPRFVRVRGTRTRDDRLRPPAGPGPSRFRRPVAQRPVERAVDRPAHAPRTAAPYEAVDSTVMARAFRDPGSPPKSATAGTQSDYRESEAQTAPYAPEAFLPTRPSTRQRALNALHNVPGTNGEPEVLTLRDPNYDAGAPLGAADVDRLERARAKRAFEASLPPLSDTARICTPAAPADGGVGGGGVGRSASARSRCGPRGTARGFESRHRRARGGGGERRRAERWRACAAARCARRAGSSMPFKRSACRGLRKLELRRMGARRARWRRRDR